MNADGTEPVRLTHNTVADIHPTWSPNGLKIAYNSKPEKNCEIYVMNADGTQPVRLTKNATACSLEPVWSPDGTKIAFMSNRSGKKQIYLMNADGTGQERIIGRDMVGDHPAWRKLIRLNP